MQAGKNYAGGKNLENSINVQVEKFQRMAKTRLDKCTDGIITVLIDKSSKKIFKLVKLAKFSRILDFQARIFS